MAQPGRSGRSQSTQRGLSSWFTPLLLIVVLLASTANAFTSHKTPQVVSRCPLSSARQSQSPSQSCSSSSRSTNGGRRAIIPTRHHPNHQSFHRPLYRTTSSSFLTTTSRDMSQDDDDDNDDNNINDSSNDDNDSMKQPLLQLSPLKRAVQKFKARPGTYLLIPCVAAIVGWFTNWLAVQMIFYPVTFGGIPLLVRPEVPLGLIGWQGIVPCKTRPMSEAMVHMVSTQLLTVKEAFGRLDPATVGALLAPEIPDITVDLLKETLPGWMGGAVGGLLSKKWAQGILLKCNKNFVAGLTVQIQANIDQVFSLKSCVVEQMMQDRTMLGQLFKKCGQAELDFLTNSGLWFGFLLGLIQMAVALFWDNPWSLSIGGGIVGLATNWLALKWIFEPVDPIKIGPWLVQGKFLKRQTEVAKEFSNFFANNILTSEQLWKSVLEDPVTKPAFAKMFSNHVTNFVRGIARVPLDAAAVTAATAAALTKLPSRLPVLYSYMDSTLKLEDTLRVRMEHMTSRQFERVLHPIFEEDELTLILAGAVLGFAAGLVQQGIETGKIKIPNFWTPLKKHALLFAGAPRAQSVVYMSQLRVVARNLRQRIRERLANPFKNPNSVNGLAAGGGSSTASQTSDDDQEDTGESSTEDNEGEEDVNAEEPVDKNDADEPNDNDPEPI